MKIPSELIPSAYEVSKNILEGKLTKEEGVDRISGKGKMVRGSASIYIAVFQQLIQGKKITYTLNAPSLEYCLQNILKDYGALNFSSSLSSLKQHIDYCEKRKNINMGKLRAVYEKYLNDPSPGSK